MLKGQVALITGASSGIGEAISKMLADEGVSLFLVGRNKEQLDQLANALCSRVSVMTFKANLIEEDHIQELSSFVAGNTQSLDILIHSAGYFVMGSFEELSVEDFDRLYQINVRAPFLITKTLLPLIRKSKGQIVFINSTAGLHARRKVSQYAATKHALKAIADSLREEVNPEKIRVLSIYPGRTATPMQEKVHKLECRDYKPELLIQPRDIAEVVINALRMPKSAEVTDIFIRPMEKI